MPTPRVMPQPAQRTSRPVLLTNLCLAWAMLKGAGVKPPAAHKKRDEALLEGLPDVYLNLITATSADVRETNQSLTT